MTEAIVGINQAGEVRAMFCIDTPKNERDAAMTAARWQREGRTVKRCSEAHAAEVLGKQWHEPNAPADLPAEAGKVRRDVGQINTDERITVEGTEILRYTEGCDGTIFDHAAGGPPTRCIRCDRWTCLCPYCPRCIADDLKLPNAQGEAGSVATSLHADVRRHHER